MATIDELYENIKNNITNESDSENLYNLLHSYQEQQIQEKKKSQSNQKIFNHFFQENTIYYNKTSKIFFNYMDNHFIPCNEDNIIYYILDFMSCNKNEYDDTFDINMKQNLKGKIIKYIKDKCNIYDNIPETETIQEIISFFVPSIFTEKEYAKFFLIILGDIILKKHTKKIHVFIKNNLKSFMNDLNKHISIYFTNLNILNYFKFKYATDHDNYELFLLPCNEINFDFIKLNTQFFINLICVSIYYSNRFENCINYLENEDICKDIINTIKYFDNNTKHDIINSFKSQYLKKDKKQSIVEKDILFLWKKFNNENNTLINLFSNYHDFLHELFLSCDCSYQKDSNQNILYNHYSLYTPNISFFINFWNENFYVDEHEYYFELNEILFLFKKYDKHKKHNFNELLISYIIQVNFPEHSIINKKIIHNLGCSLWNKKEEIDKFLSNEKYDINTENNTQLYKNYCQYKPNKNSLKISKKYFNMYLNELRK